MEKLKAVLIWGKGIILDQSISDLFNKSGYLIIGNREHGTSSDSIRTSVGDKIDSNTKIIICAYRKGRGGHELCLDDSTYYMSTWV